ncbi:uncharacterized protein TRIVIDRAFT_224416 [Trichoderma virens Gv29-8]|uniref:Uncharacterized protein n=1 Tax=Hypocrea virens (strain Gv29-8 / FGSC 10586) TaxID=413071 RepID=G9N046_HYPVG|nr:uncharacterized protein TRIVIDRAFT_224416 [Trichoderma virens Gv29-8]EHK19728.1 hypothetical protein TRIVIDRAFT_224416 [Trichoderma virens Gv29-8]UKZ53123.1 hypothetical protein TrVGV298_006913 [Trichoderma virens]
MYDAIPGFCNDAVAEKRTEKRQVGRRSSRKHAALTSKALKKTNEKLKRTPGTAQSWGRKCPWTPPSIAPETVVGRTSHGSFFSSKGSSPELYPSTWDILARQDFRPPTAALGLGLGSCSLLRKLQAPMRRSPYDAKGSDPVFGVSWRVWDLSILCEM